MRKLRELTQEEFDYLTSLNVMSLTRISKNDFDAIVQIQNEVTGSRKKANIGCGACLYETLQVMRKIYLLHINDTNEKRTHEQPTRETEGGIEQSHDGSEGSIQESSDNESTSDGGVVKRGRKGRPRKGNRPSSQNQ